MVVDVQLGVVQPTIEVVVSRVVDVRQPLTESPVPHLLLAHGLVEPEQHAAIAILVLQEPDLGIEVLAGASRTRSRRDAASRCTRSRRCRRSRGRQAGRLRARGEAGHGEVLADTEPGVRAERAIPVVRPCALPVAVRFTNIAPMPERFGSSRLTRITEKLFAGHVERVVRLHVQDADVEAVDLAGQTAARHDWNEQTVLVQADAAAEEQIELIALADRKEPGVLEEERPLLGEAEVEAGEVDLLRVHLDLREVGVVGDIQVQARRHAELRVEAQIAVEVGRAPGANSGWPIRPRTAAA